MFLDKNTHPGSESLPQPLPSQLSPDLWKTLHGMTTIRAYENGATLFRQGETVSGLYVIDSGLVRVLLPTTQPVMQLLDVVGAGTILGLSETMSGESYRLTAESKGATTAAFIPREGFLEFLEEHPDFCMQVVRLLSEDLHSLYHKFRNISAHPGRPRRRTPEEQLN